MNAVFLNRQEAGSKLAQKLTHYQKHPQAIVVGLPRGGVPVVYEEDFSQVSDREVWDLLSQKSMGVVNG